MPWLQSLKRNRVAFSSPRSYKTPLHMAESFVVKERGPWRGQWMTTVVDSSSCRIGSLLPGRERAFYLPTRGRQAEGFRISALEMGPARSAVAGNWL
jgi:hypothetical protein